MTSMGVLIAAAAVLWTSAFLPPNSSAQPAGRTTGVCQAIRVSAPKAPGQSSRARRRASLEFSASEILDLEFLVTLPSESASQGRKIELKLFTPRGHLYQTLKVTSTDEASLDGKTKKSKRRSRMDTVTATLPVAGTTIVNSSLYGTWKAEAYLEGESLPCAKARSFTIEP